MNVIGGIERLAEGHRVAGQEGQLDIVPVVAAHILDHRPALQAAGVAGGVQDHAVARLPQRRRHHVAHAHGAPAIAPDLDGEHAPVAHAMRRHGGQGGFKLALDGVVEKTHRVRLLENELLDAGAGHQADPVPGDGALLVGQGNRLGLNADQAAAQLTRPGGDQFGAALGIEQGHRRGQIARFERKVAEYLAQRVAAGKTDRADPPDAVVDDKALEHVVDLVEAQIERQFRVAVDHGLVLVIGDAAGRQHDALQLEFLRRHARCEGTEEYGGNYGYAGRNVDKAHDDPPRELANGET